jgi:hypothetical protein
MMSLATPSSAAGMGFAGARTGATVVLGGAGSVVGVVSNVVTPVVEGAVVAGSVVETNL